MIEAMDVLTGEKMCLLKDTYLCSKCKERTPVGEIIVYNKKKFCRGCYDSQVDYDKTANYIIKLFGLKCMGPLMNAQRLQLLKKGMNDDEIVAVLKYVYEVRSRPRTVESLYIVGLMREEAAEYYKKKDRYVRNIQKNMEAAVNAVSSVSYINIDDGSDETDTIDEDSFFSSLK